MALDSLRAAHRCQAFKRFDASDPGGKQPKEYDEVTHLSGNDAIERDPLNSALLFHLKRLQLRLRRNRFEFSAVVHQAARDAALEQGRYSRARTRIWKYRRQVAGLRFDLSGLDDGGSGNGSNQRDGGSCATP